MSSRRSKGAPNGESVDETPMVKQHKGEHQMKGSIMVRKLLLTSCHSPLPPLKLWKQQLVQLHCYPAQPVVALYCHYNLSGPSHLLLLLLLLCLFPQF